MVGKKRTLRPESSQKLAVTIAGNVAGRLGEIANNPLIAYTISSFALSASQNWYSKRSIATQILREALGDLGKIPAMEHAKVNALASAASKVIINAGRGTLPADPCTYIDTRLTEVANVIGASQDEVGAVSRAAKKLLNCPGAQ